MTVSRAALKQALDEWNDWYVRTKDQLKPRRATVTLPKKNALALVGVRRGGKTHLAVELAKRSGLNVLYFNFEDPLFYEDNSTSHLDTLLSIFTEYHSKKEEPQLLVLDEIQNINGWERWVRKQVDLGLRRIVLTGSSAKLLSAELATAIAGRCLEQTLWPLSYLEFLEFSQTKCANPNQHLSALREFFSFGGFPEVVLEPDESEKKKLLRQYLSDIVIKDIISRNQIRNKRSLDQVIQHYFSNPSSLHSYNSLRKAYGLNTETAAEYTRFLSEAFLVFEVPCYHPNLKVQARDPKKIYVIDTGLRNAISRSPQDDTGKLAENVVFLHLLRQGKTISYFKGNREVDFLETDQGKPIAATQVCYDELTERKTFDREIAALLECLTEIHLKEGTIITRTREEIISVGKLTINCIPLYRWLLSQDS